MLAIVQFYFTERWWPVKFMSIDGQLNVGETQMTKFSSNRPVKSTLTTDQSLAKRALNITPSNITKVK